VNVLDLAESLDVDVVQFADNLPLHTLSGEQLDALHSAAERRSILLEIGTRGTDPANLYRYLQIAQRLGAPLVRTIIENSDLKLARRQIQETLPLFEASGTVLGIENHGGQTVDQLAQLIREFDSPFLGCCLDTVNSFGALEGSRPALSALLPLAVNIHVKDFYISRLDHQMGFLLLGRPTGKGMLDVASMIRETIKLGRDPNLIVELWVPYEDTVEQTIVIERQWLDQSVEYLKKVVHAIHYNA
jgi:3-oxoisoapionate decarboxylase